MERAATIWKPNNLEISHTCPRCGSINTKFCYYNNYSLTQPRYFCKGCRRYWTKGGSLRNVPIGGGCRKIRRGKSSSISGTSSKKGLDNRRLFIDPESSSDGPTSPTTANIDLAAVYANFMNQKPQPQPSHIIQETPANNNDGPSFEFSGYPTMLNMDYFVPENGLAHNQDGGFIMGEYGNHAGLFHEQFCNNNNNNNSDINMMSSLPPILPDIQEEGIGIGIGIGWPNDNSDINMMFHNKSGVIEPAEVQGCPNHHTNNSSSSLFSIPSYESIFRP